MSFITDATLKTAVANRLKQAEANLASYWTEIIAEANSTAYKEIIGRLLGRGFTKTQIDQWDRGAEFQKAIGLHRALTDGGALDNFSDAMLRQLDRRGELDKLSAMEINGVWVKPGNTDDTPGMVGFGSMSTSGDLFVPIDPNDGNMGEVTRW